MSVDTPETTTEDADDEQTESVLDEDDVSVSGAYVEEMAAAKELVDNTFDVDGYIEEYVAEYEILHDDIIATVDVRFTSLSRKEEMLSAASQARHDGLTVVISKISGLGFSSAVRNSDYDREMFAEFEIRRE